MGLGSNVFVYDTKAHSTKAKINIKHKTLAKQKQQQKKNEKAINRMGQNIYNHILDKGLISKICKGHIQLN